MEVGDVWGEDGDSEAERVKKKPARNVYIYI
jgi:hypothetical protein